MFGDQEALVLEVSPLSVHGLVFYDVKVAFRDRSVHDARLGPEAVPEGIHPGDLVTATLAANMIVALRRSG
jgi:hypothetical protein